MSNFFNTLRDMRAGHTIDELDAALIATVAAVKDVGKTGTLTLTVTVKPASKGNGAALLIEDKITTKLPEFDRGATIFFADDNYHLTRHDPSQKELDLRVVPETEINEIDSASA